MKGDSADVGKLKTVPIWPSESAMECNNFTSVKHVLETAQQVEISDVLYVFTQSMTSVLLHMKFNFIFIAELFFVEQYLWLGSMVYLVQDRLRNG